LPGPQADALAQYEGPYGGGRVKHCGCRAHAHRKFVAGAEAGEERAGVALGWVRRLYAIERELLPPSEDPVARQQRPQREEQRR
jgi:transposase